MASLTLDQLHTYHAIDRNIFSKLVTNYLRDPVESLLVMATWLWLEDKGFPAIIPKLLAFSDSIIDAIADEAVSSFRCLESSVPPIGSGLLPLTTRLMSREITLHMIYDQRYTAISGIKSFLATVCSRIFSDILQRILPSSSFISIHLPLIIPGFPHPTFGHVTVMPNFVPTVEDEFSRFPDGLWAWNPSRNATENDRTMFLTFSRGFPVTQVEVKELFTTTFGENAVEGVHMQESSGSNDQPLFARIVLDSVATVDRVLGGRRIAKFRINGKHIWARKYERRDLPSA
ncbi:PREDICTED: uncharacterized protein LOC104815016 [Tarenaya hassleriana]|uniref:uncharacterized protein LOC104815016 n=1 Tax=Tarenaya hassleriana TaxID=28532 RepID=UPI00053C1866|nr:PREDICTED: uncharacterized protein LOC104815016 [Tarenaya hassleriana]